MSDNHYNESDVLDLKEGATLRVRRVSGSLPRAFTKLTITKLMIAAVCVLKTIIEQRDGVLDLQSIRLATADAAGKQSKFYVAIKLG